MPEGRAQEASIRKLPTKQYSQRAYIDNSLLKLCGAADRLRQDCRQPIGTGSLPVHWSDFMQLLASSET